MRRKPASVTPPEGAVPSSRPGVAPALTLLDLPRFCRKRLSRCSGRAPNFRALLRVWVGVDSVPLPVRHRPILPWVFDSPSRCLESFRFALTVAGKLRSGGGVATRRCMTPTTHRDGSPLTGGSPSRDIPLTFAPRPLFPTRGSDTVAVTHRSGPPREELVRVCPTDSVTLFAPTLRRGCSRGQSRPSWGF